MLLVNCSGSVYVCECAFACVRVWVGGVGANAYMHVGRCLFIHGCGIFFFFLFSSYLCMLLFFSFCFFISIFFSFLFVLSCLKTIYSHHSQVYTARSFRFGKPEVR